MKTILSAIAVSLMTTCLAQAQTFNVLHTFGGADGSQPFAGVTRDTRGTLYGTTEYGGILNCDEGGIPGCGVVYSLKNRNSNWVFSVLYEFPGINGFLPTDPGNITIAPNGTPFGTQYVGGAFNGTLYNLLPSLDASVAVNAPWSYKLIHEFGLGNDGSGPSQITFDSAGNIFGAAIGGGSGGGGVIYELTPSNGTWTETILYSFLGGADGTEPVGVFLEDSGDIYGVTRSGGNQECRNNFGCGTVYKLTRSGSTWTKTILHVFESSTEGGNPGPLVRDSAGNLFGLTNQGASGNGGTIWELSPSNGAWVLTVLYTFPGPTLNSRGPFRPAMDASGTLYGNNNWGGANNLGSVYKLAPSNGSWVYTDLHDFGSLPNNTDGCYPSGPVALDPDGNIYGATQQCGAGGGTVYEVTP